MSRFSNHPCANQGSFSSVRTTAYGVAVEADVVAQLNSDLTNGSHDILALCRRPVISDLVWEEKMSCAKILRMSSATFVWLNPVLGLRK